MSLAVSLIVLFLSILCLSPLLDAYRLPNGKIQNSNRQAQDATLTVNNNDLAYGRPIYNEPTYIFQQKLFYLNKLLSEQSFYGIWNGSQQDKQANFGSNEGFVTLNYAVGHHDSEETFDMTLCLYNGLFTNTNYSCLTFSESISFMSVDSFNDKNATISFNEGLIYVAEGSTNRINTLGKECVAETSFYFINTEQNTPLHPSYDKNKDRANLGIQFKIQSSECNLDFMTTIMTHHEDLVQGQSMNYSVLMSVGAVFQCLLCYGLNLILQKHKSFAQKVSQGTLRIIQCFDLFICLQSLILFNSNVMIGFMMIPYGILSFYFQNKTMRTIREAQGSLKDRGYLWTHRINFLSFMVSGFIAVASAVFRAPELMLIVLSLYQLPQILQNFNMERKQRKSSNTVLLFVLPKLAYMIYVLAFPRNLFRYTANPSLLAILSAVLCGQFILSIYQQRSATFCVKRKCAYKFYMLSKKQVQEEVCSICLENLETSTTDNGDNLLPKKNDDKTMVLTPCQHQFHECCLRDWAQHKSVCPYCRYTLPPLPENDD